MLGSPDLSLQRKAQNVLNVLQKTTWTVDVQTYEVSESDPRP